jgi:hypothetical protein
MDLKKRSWEKEAMLGGKKMAGKEKRQFGEEEVVWEEKRWLREE